jgi:hypothetical protein
MILIKLTQKKVFDFINSPCETVEYDFSPLKMVEYIKKELYGEV